MTAHPADPSMDIAGTQAGRQPAHPAATAAHPTSKHPTARHPGGAVPVHLAGEWALFTDWCAATGQPPLPASVDTVLAFLADLPASPAVTGRRVRAIRVAHTRTGLLTPALPDLAGSSRNGHLPATMDSG